MTASPSRSVGDGILVEHVSRRYGRDRSGQTLALDDVSLEVPQGTTLALLGPNGAGKTTLARILTTLLVPSSGRAWVAGHDVVADPRAVQRRCGVAFGGETGLYGRLSARDNLRYFATLYRLSRREARSRIPELLELVGLGDRGGDRVETFSRGMKQRLHIARALIHDPAVVILDEPSSGLDPQGAHELRQLVRELSARERTILLTTHDLREAEELCERVAILLAGRVVELSTPRALREAAARELGECVEIDDGRLVPDDLIEHLPGLRRWDRDGDRVLIYTLDAPAAIAILLESCAPAPTIQVTRPSLETAYLNAVAAV